MSLNLITFMLLIIKIYTSEKNSMIMLTSKKWSYLCYLNNLSYLLRNEDFFYDMKIFFIIYSNQALENKIIKW